MAGCRSLLLTALILGGAQLSTGWGLTLDEALQEALKNNPEIRRAKAGIEEAGGEKIVLRSIALPTVGLTGVVGAQSEYSTTTGAAYGLGIGMITQPLIDARIPASWRLGNLRVLIAQQELNVTVTEVLHETRVTFCEALYKRDLAALAREQQGRLQANFRTEKNRLQAGVGTEDAVVRAESQELAIDPDRVAAEHDWQLARTLLARHLGRSLEAGKGLPDPEGSLRYQNVKIDLQSDAGAALKQRPDLKLLRSLVQAAREKKIILQAAYYPFITLFASEQVIPKGGVGNDSSGILSLSAQNLTAEFEAGAQLTWRIIDNGAVRGAVLQKQKLYEIDQVMLTKLEQDVPRELFRVRRILTQIDGTVAALQSAEANAEKNLMIVEKSISAGQATQLDYRQAQDALWQVQSNFLKAKFEQAVALAERDRARGYYFQFSFAEP